MRKLLTTELFALLTVTIVLLDCQMSAATLSFTRRVGRVVYASRLESGHSLKRLSRVQILALSAITLTGDTHHARTHY